MPGIALYAGSFDPVTKAGHIDVVRHAVRLADRLVLAIGVHPRQGAAVFRRRAAGDAGRNLRGRSAAPPNARFPASPSTIWWSRPPAKPARGFLIRGPARRLPIRLRNADGRHERDHGAGGADRVSCRPRRGGCASITATLVRRSRPWRGGRRVSGQAWCRRTVGGAARKETFSPLNPAISVSFRDPHARPCLLRWLCR